MEQFRVRLRDKVTGEYIPVPKAQAAGSGTAYEAASSAPRLARWTGSSAGPQSSIARDLPQLRRRSRDRRRNDGVADSAIEIMTANAIGTGIKPQWRTPDRDLNKALAQLWLDWTDFADPEGRCDFYGLQALAFAGMMEGGDIFGRMRVRRIEDGLPVPLQIQLLEGEHCPVEKSEATATGKIVNGVEFNLIGQRVAYWLYPEHPGDAGFRPGLMNVLSRVAAEEVIHLAGARRVSSIRGEPWLSRALLTMYDVDQMNDAVVTRVKVANLFAGFISPGADGKFPAGTAGEANPDANGRQVASLEPGLMQVLGPGESVNFTDPPEAGSTYEAFLKIQMRRIAASVGLLYEQLSGDYSGINDRTWRSGMNEFYRRLERIQYQLVAFQFCRPIAQKFVELAILSGAIKVPAGVPVNLVMRPAWIAPVRPYINPVQDVAAKRDEVRAGFTSRSQIVAEQGEDIEDLDAEIARDKRRADDLGLVFDSDAKAVSQAGVSQTPGSTDNQGGQADPQQKGN